MELSDIPSDLVLLNADVKKSEIVAVAQDYQMNR